MALTDNFGTQVYLQSCFVTSPTSVNPLSNAGTAYFGASANSFILYGVPSVLPQPSTNKGSTFYAPPCVAVSTPGLDLESNGTAQFYYSSAFNCVTFCDPIFRSGNTSNH